jgi:putative endonuclease
VADPRHALGRRAEEAAAGWLVRTGWTVLERRWRCAAGELDLVCRDTGGALVGVEVKLRRTGRAGSAAESIDRRRLARLRVALGAYASGRRDSTPPSAVRIDLITVERDGDRWRLRRVPAIDAW